MKAWKIRDKEGKCGTEIVFAETRGKAISYALSYLDYFENCEFTDLYARRFKDFDKHYNGRQHRDFWFDDEIRIILVRDYGWCCDECYEGKNCPAHPYCAEYFAENE